MLEKVQFALDDYQTRYRRSDVSPIKLSEPYSLFPEETYPPADSEMCWPAPYPQCDRKGVYFIFGQTGRLLYIGKASLSSSLGTRLGRYFQYAEDRKRCMVRNGELWTEPPRFLATAAVPEDMPFEASALEEYLIAKLNPSDNVTGGVRARVTMDL